MSYFAPVFAPALRRAVRGYAGAASNSLEAAIRSIPGLRALYIADLATAYQDAAGTTAGALEAPVGRRLDKSGNGSHMTQSTAAARWVVSGRRNLFERSHDLSNAYWGKTRVTVAANNHAAPNGTITADKVDTSATGSGASVLLNAGGTMAATAGAKYTYTHRFKAGSIGWVVFNIGNGAGTNYARRWFNLSAGTLGGAAQVGAGLSQAGASITSLGNGWYECAFTVTADDSALRGGFTVTNADGAFASTLGDFVYAWGAQLELGPTATRYQWVNTPTDYDTAGFPTFDRFDGVDDAGNVTFATALGAASTVVRTLPDGTLQYLEGQNIGTSFANVASYHGMAIFDRALTIGERNTVSRALSLLAGRAPPAPVVASLSGAPGVSATAGNAQAFVTLTAPASDGGSPILDYTITRQPGDVNQVVASPGTYTFDGLANGVQHSFSAKARTDIGFGASSATVNVTPVDAVSADTFDAFRMVVTETSGGVAPIVGEIGFRSSTNGSPLTGTPFASTEAGAGNAAAKAFDGDGNTYAQTAIGDPAPHFGLTLATPQQLAEVLVTFPTLEFGNTDGAPLALNFEGLKSGTWTNLKAFTATGWNPGESKLFTLQALAGSQVNALTNSGLGTATGWNTSASGVTIANGECTFSGTSSGTLWQTAANMARVPVSGETVRARFRLPAYTEGNINPRLAMSDGSFVYFYSGDATGNNPLAGNDATAAVGTVVTTPSFVVPNGLTVADAAMRVTVRNGSVGLTIDDFEVLIG